MGNLCGPLGSGVLQKALDVGVLVGDTKHWGIYGGGTGALGSLERTLGPQGPDRRHWNIEFLVVSCVEVFRRRVSWPSGLTLSSLRATITIMTIVDEGVKRSEKTLTS